MIKTKSTIFPVFEWSGPFEIRLHREPFEIRPSKSLDFEYFQISNHHLNNDLKQSAIQITI